MCCCVKIRADFQPDSNEFQSYHYHDLVFNNKILTLVNFSFIVRCLCILVTPSGGNKATES